MNNVISTNPNTYVNPNPQPMKDPYSGQVLASQGFIVTPPNIHITPKPKPPVLPPVPGSGKK